jgi:hypothetical protein
VLRPLSAWRKLFLIGLDGMVMFMAGRRFSGRWAPGLADASEHLLNEVLFLGLFSCIL